jgi:hypothetical protein
VTRARLRFPHGDPLEVDLDEVVAYGPEIRGFRAWLGAVFASREGRYLVRFDDDRVLGFTRDELKRVRVSSDGAELVLGAGEEAVGVREADVRSFGPEPEGARAWLGRLAHGSGEAWIRLRDGTEMRFPIGGGPHVTFVG